MKLCTYNYLAIFFILFFNYVAGSKDDLFYRKVKRYAKYCNRGDILRDDRRCVTCFCRSPGVMACIAGRCRLPKPTRPAYKREQNKTISSAHALSAPRKITFKVTGCTPDMVQTLNDCFACECLSTTMTCIEVKRCDPEAAASLDYLFGDTESDIFTETFK